jgi:hypothetical protein
MSYSKRILQVMVIVFAIIGFIFVAMFFAIRFHLTNVSGSVDPRSDDFEKANTQKTQQVMGVSDEQPSKSSFSSTEPVVMQLTPLQKTKQENACSLLLLNPLAPQDVASIARIALLDYTEIIVSKMIFALEGALGNQDTLLVQRDACVVAGQYVSLDLATLATSLKEDPSQSAFAWSRDAEWQSIQTAIQKDKDVINKAASAANIEPRLIVASLIVEQIRLFHSQRELFKKFFEPLKILGNSTVISLGVMGIKPPTAKMIEHNLKNSTSLFYLGTSYEHLLDYPDGVESEKERFARLTDEKNHYWSYLYGALYLKQMMRQWSIAGYDILYRPEIIATLFNVGFSQSHPNAHPQVGGSTIHVDDTHAYSFGRLGYEFYYSGQFLDEFPYQIKNKETLTQ